MVKVYQLDSPKFSFKFFGKFLARVHKLLFNKRLAKFFVFFYLLLIILRDLFYFQPTFLETDLLSLLWFITLIYFLIVLTVYFIKNLKEKKTSLILKKLILLLIISTFLILGISLIVAGHNFFESLFFFPPFILCISLVLTIIIRLILTFFKLNKKQVFRAFICLFVLLLVGGFIFLGIFLHRVDLRLALIERRLGGPQKLACDEKEAIERVKNATVRIVGGYSEGTGFIVKESGIIITNFHVVAFEPSPKIVLPNYEFRTAEVILGNKDVDLAILKIEGENYPSLSLGTSVNLEKMDKVYAIGFPLGSELSGEASVVPAIFVAWRTFKDEPVGYLQLDGAINPGISGGPVITPCGEVVGIATAGIYGMGLAISSRYAQDEWLAMTASQEKPEIKTISFEPEKGPKEAVEAFYNYIKIRKLKEAYELISKKRIGETTFEEWKKGYANTLDVSLVDLYEEEEEEDKVFVKIQSKDLVGQDIVFRYFEGTWQVEKEGATHRLNQSNIKEIETPDFGWYITKKEREEFEKLFRKEE